MELKAVESAYARWAPVYDHTFGALTRAGRGHAVDYINARQGEVLEVGIGTGLSLPRYSGHLAVTGIDFSQDMLDKARERVRAQRLSQVRALHRMDARALEFPDASFDTVAAMHIISVVPEPTRVMAEIARVCRPGGRVVITNHFAREAGLLAMAERVTAPFANLLGWHSDFRIETVTAEPRLRLIERRSLPPFGVMTFLAFERLG